MDLRLPEFQSGEYLKADDLNDIVDAVRRQRLLTGQNSGLNIQEGPNGTTIRVVSQANRYVAYVLSPGITAQTGGAPGTGTVMLQVYDPGNGTWEDSGNKTTVLNFSATPIAGFPANKYCWVEQDTDGNYILVSIEC